jgi:hypothetical protein
MHITYSRYYPDGAQTQPAETYQVRRIATALKCKMRPQDFSGFISRSNTLGDYIQPICNVQRPNRQLYHQLNPLSTGIV